MAVDLEKTAQNNLKLLVSIRYNKKNYWNIYYMPGTVLSAWYVFSGLIPHKNQRSIIAFKINSFTEVYFLFIDEKLRHFRSTHVYFYLSIKSVPHNFG